VLPPGESIRTPTIFARFPTNPRLTPPLGGIPSEFLDETYTPNRRGMGLLYGENCMPLTSTVFDWSTRMTGGQTDGQAIAYSALSICCRTLKTANPLQRIGAILVYGFTDYWIISASHLHWYSRATISSWSHVITSSLSIHPQARSQSTFTLIIHSALSVCCSGGVLCRAIIRAVMFILLHPGKVPKRYKCCSC